VAFIWMLGVDLKEKRFVHACVVQAGWLITLSHSRVACLRLEMRAELGSVHNPSAYGRGLEFGV